MTLTSWQWATSDDLHWPTVTRREQTPWAAGTTRLTWRPAKCWLRHSSRWTEYSPVSTAILMCQQTQSICVTFIQCRSNVKDVGPTLYKCYTTVLCLLGWPWVWISVSLFLTSLLFTDVLFDILTSKNDYIIFLICFIGRLNHCVCDWNECSNIEIWNFCV